MVLQRSLLHKQLRAAARTDAKTGLLNAGAWQREADAEVSRALRAGDPLALLVIDVDHFKRVNDAHGHLVGDEVLVGLAVALNQALRDRDLVGRFGGEEFVALLPRAGAAEAYRIAERLRIRVSRMTVPVLVGGNDAETVPAGGAAGGHGTDGVPGVAAMGPTVGVTISIGVSVLGMHGCDMFELLAAADLALYQAKESGRDRVCLFAHGDDDPGNPWQQPARAGAPGS
jgi:diguanylate cyclase (GGDEF)-like protein